MCTADINVIDYVRKELGNPRNISHDFGNERFKQLVILVPTTKGYN